MKRRSKIIRIIVVLLLLIFWAWYFLATEKNTISPSKKEAVEKLLISGKK